MLFIMITWNKKFSLYVLSVDTGFFHLFLSYFLFDCFGFFSLSSFQLVEVKTTRSLLSAKNHMYFSSSCNF